MSNKTNIQLWQKLSHKSCRDLPAAVAAFDDLTHPGVITHLRKHWPPDLVAAAITLTIARRKAAKKFADPEHLFVDPIGVEQATGIEVARYKARRFAEIGADRIIDLCCGIGGDAMALAGIADMMLIDTDPGRAWMARHAASGCCSGCNDPPDIRHPLSHRSGATYSERSAEARV